MVWTNYCHASEMMEHDTNKNRPSYFISQVAAAAVGTLVTINLSSMSSITTIVNGALKVKFNETNSTSILTESFMITETQASIYTTLGVITTLFGTMLSGLYQDAFGRKNCLMVSAIPQICSWYILYFATSAYWLYAHALAVGIGAAFSEHVFVTYVSEIASVEMRGRLFSVGKFGYGIGASFTFMLANFYHWRKLTLALSILPKLLPLYLLWLPETPLWLLSKERDQGCRQSLKWLRGWTSEQNIDAEYQKLRMQLEQRKAVSDGNTDYRVRNYVKLFTKPEFFRPFLLALVMLFSSFLLSLRGIKLYFINFLDEFDVHKEDKMKIMTLTGVSGIVGCVLLVLTIHKFGKRALTLWTFSAAAICVYLFAVYMIVHKAYGFNAVWMLYVLSAVLNILGGYTLAGMPWFVISEIFPQKYRGFCSGIVGVLGQLMISGLTGTYFYLVKKIGVTNLLLAYGIVGVICIVYLYEFLPETENKSLHEIEEYFRKKNTRTAINDGCQGVHVKLVTAENFKLVTAEHLVSSGSTNEDLREKE